MEIIVGIILVVMLITWVMAGYPALRYVLYVRNIRRREAFRRRVEHQRRIDAGTARKHL